MSKATTKINKRDSEKINKALNVIVVEGYVSFCNFEEITIDATLNIKQLKAIVEEVENSEAFLALESNLINS